MPRRAARVDENQSQIVDALRQIGCSVTPTHAAGDGFPAITVGWQGVNYLLEIKNPEKPPSKRKLTKDQQEWHARMEGAGRSCRDRERGPRGHRNTVQGVHFMTLFAWLNALNLLRKGTDRDDAPTSFSALEHKHLSGGADMSRYREIYGFYIRFQDIQNVNGHA